MKSLKLRTLVFLAIGFATLGSCLFMSGASTGGETGVIVHLPDQIPGHRSETMEMSEIEKKWLPDDTTHLSKRYREEGLADDWANYRAINATLIVAGADSRSLHRPQVCLTAQNWSIKKREVVALETSGGELEVMDYHLSRFVANEDGSTRVDENGKKIIQRAHYVYWWVGPDDSTASDSERVWKSVWNSILKGENERWAYPSVMVLVDERSPEKGSEEARERAFEFIRNYAPGFQKSLMGAEDG